MYAILARGIVVVVACMHIIVGVTSNHFAIFVTNRDIRCNTAHATGTHNAASLLLTHHDDILMTSLCLRHRHHLIEVGTAGWSQRACDTHITSLCDVLVRCIHICPVLCPKCVNLAPVYMFVITILARAWCVIVTDVDVSLGADTAVPRQVSNT